MISKGKSRYIGKEYLAGEPFQKLVEEKCSLATANDPDGFLQKVQGWASLNAYMGWLKAYKTNAGNFLDHHVWGADRHLGGGVYLYGAMDDRFATNAARVFVPNGLDAAKHVEGKSVCVIGAWDGTECLLLRVLGAASVDAVEEVPAFCEMAKAQYQAWEVPGEVFTKSLYEIDVETSWQKYDLVYVPGVLYHLTDLPTALTILWAIIKPGGVLAFESIVDPPGGKKAQYLGPSTPGWNWWSPTAECYEGILRDCGFPDGRTVEMASNRGWWVGTRAEHALALKNGAAGFSRPDVLRTIARLHRSH